MAVVDTSAWVAAKNWRDVNHAAAAAALSDLADRRERLVTTDFVLDETYTALLYEIGYPATVRFRREIEAMTGKGTVTLIHVTPELQEQAWAVFERFNRDKRWSFTDCTSYAVIRQEGLTQVFAYDEHFAQMGFTVSSAGP